MANETHSHAMKLAFEFMEEVTSFESKEKIDAMTHVEKMAVAFISLYFRNRFADNEIKYKFCKNDPTKTLLEIKPSRIFSDLAGLRIWIDTERICSAGVPRALCATLKEISSYLM